MSRPNDILIEWAEEHFDNGTLAPEAFVPLHGKQHSWHAWSRLKAYPQFSDIIHECLVAVPWTEDTHPIGVMLKIVYPFAYPNGWDGLYKDIVKLGCLPMLVSRFIDNPKPSFIDQRAAEKEGTKPTIRAYTHIILPTEVDAVLTAGLLGIFDDEIKHDRF